MKRCHRHGKFLCSPCRAENKKARQYNPPIDDPVIEIPTFEMPVIVESYERDTWGDDNSCGTSTHGGYSDSHGGYDHCNGFQIGDHNVQNNDFSSGSDTSSSGFDG